MNKEIAEIMEHVKLYFKENLPQYTVLDIRRKSYHPDDDYLYMVSAQKNDGTFAVWTSWNETMQILNYGHYDLPSADDCEKIFEEYQNIQPYCEVYKSSQTAQLRLFVAETEEMAIRFCEEHDWILEDENGFLWDLDYSRVNSSAPFDGKEDCPEHQKHKK